MTSKRFAAHWKIASFALMLCGHQALAADYTEEQYVNDVLKANKELEANVQEIQASKIDEGQVDLQLAPQLNSTLAINQDRRQQLYSSPSYDSANTFKGDVSVSQQTQSGFSYKVGLEATQTKIYGLSFGPNTPRMNAGIANLTPSVEVSQALWQNAWGRSIELQRAALTSAGRIQEKQLEAIKKGKTLEARLAYGRVVFARERLQNAQDSLSNAEKILKYVQEKAKRNLLENSDLLQSQALVASREFELRQAQGELDEAQVLFNALRSENASVPDRLENLKSIASNSRSKEFDLNQRAELSVYDEQIKATSASIELEREKTKPSLEVFASYALLSTRWDLIDTPSGFGSPYQPNTTIGVKLSMPLDQDLIDRQLRSSSVRKSATELRRENERRNLERDLKALVVKRKDSLATLAVAEKLENLQRKKLANEQQEYRNGRSTTYQILMFSQDLATAEFAKLQALYTLKIIDTQLRMYERDAT